MRQLVTQLCKNKLPIIYLIICIAFEIIVLTALYYSKVITHRDLLNGDTLFPVSLANQVIWQGQSILDWSLPPAPFFFPEISLFMIFSLFKVSAFDSMYLYMIFQVSVTFILIYFIYSLIFNKWLASLFTCLVVTYILTFLTLNPPVVHPYYFILIGTYHYGNILNGLLILYLIMKKNFSFSFARVAIIIFLTIIGVASDLFLAVTVVAPIGMALLAISYWKKEFNFKYAIYWNLLLACSALVGWLGKILITGHSYLEIGKIKSIDNILLDIKYTILNICRLTETYPSTIIFILILLYVSIVALILISNNQSKNKNNHTYVKFLSYFIVISIFLNLSSVILTNVWLNDPNDPRHFHSRYILAVFWFPILFYPVFLKKYLNNVSKKVGKMIVLALILLQAVPFLVSLKYLTKLSDIDINYYPKFIDCLDKNLSNSNLKNGIGSYGYSRPVELFSQRQLSIDIVNKQLLKAKWLSNPKLFKDKHDFVILSKANNVSEINEKLLYKLNSKPSYSFICEDDLYNNKVEVLVYGKDQVTTYPNFNKRNIFVWEGCEISFLARGVMVNRILEDHGACIIKAYGNRGTLYVHIPNIQAGEYIFTLDYRSNISKKEKIAEIDIGIEKQLISEPLFGTNSKGSKESYNLIVDKNFANKRLDFNIKFDGVGDLYIKSVSLRRK